MNAKQEALLRHLPEIAADSVLGEAHGAAYILGNHLAVALQNRENLLLPVGCQHIVLFTILLDTA